MCGGLQEVGISSAELGRLADRSDRIMTMRALLIVAVVCVDSTAARVQHPVLRSRVRSGDDEAPISTMHRLRGDTAATSLSMVHQLRGGAVATSDASKSLIGMVLAQLAYEVSSAGTHPAKLFGFCGACCNWFLGLSAVYDAANNGPEVIALPMTLAMLAYSLLFSRWAGWDVMPRNFILSGSHMFNVVAQCNQLRRVVAYKLETDPDANAELTALAKKAAGVIAAVTAFCVYAPTLKAMMPEGSYLASSGGPFTIHPWPPVTKLFLSAASLTDLHRPTAKISLTQYAALTLTGFIFTFYGLYVTPINYPLTAVNILLFLSSAWHLGRKVGVFPE